MRVFLTGATGFVGSHVLRALLEAGHSVKVLVRPGQEHRLVASGDNVEVVHGDITDAESIGTAVEGCDAVVHLVGIIKEDVASGATFERVHLDGARNVIDAATAAGVGRFALMSANGAKPREDAVSAYQWSKYEAEEHLKASGLDYVILRPSVIFGQPEPGQPEFTSQLAHDLLGVPLLPLPLFKEGLPSIAQFVKGLFPFAARWQRDLTVSGSTLEMQPVAVENVAEGRKLIRDAWRRGRSKGVAWLPALDWEALLARPLEEVRKELAVGEPPVYQEIRTEDLAALQAAS